MKIRRIILIILLCVLANSNLNIIEIFLIGGRVGRRAERTGRERGWGGKQWAARRNILNIIYYYNISLTTIIYNFISPRPRGAPPGRITILFKSPRLHFEMRCRIIFASENPLSLSHTILFSCLYSNNINNTTNRSSLWYNNNM